MTPDFEARGMYPKIAQLAKAHLLLALLLWEKHGVDVRQDTTSRNGHSREQLVELLVIADGELNMARDDARALVVASGVASKLENLGRKVLKDRCHVHWGTPTEAVRELHVAHVTRHTADGELKPSLGGPAGRLPLSLSAPR